MAKHLWGVSKPQSIGLLAKWTEVSSSRMDTVAPSPSPDGSIAGVVNAWGSAVLDTVNNRLLVWGGGHGDSADNSVYAFDLDTMTWARVYGPTANAIISASGGIESSGYYATNSGGGTPDQTAPRSRHVYNHIVFAAGKMWSLCAVATYINAMAAANLDAFDVSTDTWSRVNDSGPGSLGWDGGGVADDSGNLWHYGSGGNEGYLCHYNIEDDEWTPHGVMFGDVGAFDSDSVTYVYHPTTDRMYAIGSGKCVRWDLNPAAGNIDHVDQATTGPQDIVDAAAPGLAYHPPSGKIIGWAGGTSVYALDPSTHVWEEIDLDPTNSVTPPAQQTNGTFGRFRWSAASGLFVLVNAVNQNVLTLEI